MDLEIGSVTWSGYDADGFLGIQVDVHGDRPGMPAFELYSPYGFHSRPLDPQADGKACTAAWRQIGNQGFAWLVTDPIVQPRLPELAKGESMQYGPFGQFVRCHADGRITAYTTTTNAPDGQPVFWQVGPQGLLFESPFGRLRFDATGFHVRTASGAALHFGGIGGMPSPLDALSSYARIEAMVVEIKAAAQGTGAAHAAAVTALMVDLAAIKTALGLGPPNPLILGL